MAQYAIELLSDEAHLTQMGQQAARCAGALLCQQDHSAV